MRKQVQLQISEVHHMNGLASMYTQVGFEKHDEVEVRSLVLNGEDFPHLIPGDHLLVTIDLVRPPVKTKL